MKNTVIYACICILSVLPAGCGFFEGVFGASQILYQRQMLSRDVTYLEFTRNRSPYKIETEVGGEHIRTVKIIGFQGNKFLVEFTGITGSLSYHISEGATEFKKISPYSGTVIIREMDAIATIEMYAHPHASYTLTITPL